MRPYVVAIAALLALAGSACLITTGPDCTDACDKMLACKDLQGTFRLSCSSIASTCFEDVANCADCVDQHTCQELVAGACDPLCRVTTDGGP